MVAVSNVAVDPWDTTTVIGRGTVGIGSSGGAGEGKADCLVMVALVSIVILEVAFGTLMTVKGGCVAVVAVSFMMGVDSPVGTTAVVR